MVKLVNKVPANEVQPYSDYQGRGQIGREWQSGRIWCFASQLQCTH